jgi:hypothetical protein
MAIRGRSRNTKSALVEPGITQADIYRTWGLLVWNKYYIVDMINVLKPRYIIKPFDEHSEATNIINKFLSGNHKRFTIEQGKTIAKYRIIPYRKYLRGVISKKLLSLKYSYPVNCITNQQRKDFRTISRRRLRNKWLSKLENC